MVRGVRWGAPAGALGAALLCGGCQWDSFLDPSVLGRWESTPTVVPILERIDVIERDSGEFVETTPVTAEDLVPEITLYEIGPGDDLGLEIYDFLTVGQPTTLQRTVDASGDIELPQVGRVRVLGLTSDQVRDRLRDVLRERQILADALVSVIVLSRRQATFSIFGIVSRPGRYALPTPDYRLLEAITEAGGISPAIHTIYIIRQVPLSEEFTRGAGAGQEPLPTDRPARAPGAPPEDRGVDLEELIDRLTRPEEPTPAPTPREEEPEDLPPPDPGAWSDGWSAPGAFRSEPEAGSRRSVWATLQEQPDQPPPIDLPDESEPAKPVAPQAGTEPEDTGGWMFLNGKWVRVVRRPTTGAEGLPEGADPLGGPSRVEELVTQRIIRVPVDPLVEGAAEYNLVIRPGDIIRVPGPEQGVVYLGGIGLARPGT